MQEGNGRPRRRARWALILIAAPAAVAIWSGWVGVGGLCGFGVVNLLPGIGAGFRLNTAITLPVGAEAYGAYALGVWMAPGSPARARKFAGWSAFGALAYGLLGQVIYHLLRQAHVSEAPWPVTVVVSCMPVVVLGFAAALTHLLWAPEPDDRGRAEDPPRDVPATSARSVPSGNFEAAKVSMAETAAAGNPWSRNQLQTRFGLSRAEADEIWQPYKPPAGAGISDPPRSPAGAPKDPPVVAAAGDGARVPPVPGAAPAGDVPRVPAGATMNGARNA